MYYNQLRPKIKASISLLIDNTIFFMALGLLVVDTYNGYCLRELDSDTLRLAQLYKTVILALMLIRLVELNAKRSLFYIFLLLVTPFMSLALHNIYGYYHGSLIVELSMIIRPLLIPVSFFYFRELICSHGIAIERKIFWVFSVNAGVLLVNLLIGFLGYGYYDYRSTGALGFLYAGNEVSIVLCVVATYFFIKAYSINVVLFFLIFCFFFGISIVKGTKTAILGTLILGVAVPFFWGKSSIWTLNHKNILVLFASIFCGFMLFDVGYSYLIESDFFSRLEYLFFNKGLEVAALSGRYELLVAGTDIYYEKYNFYEYFFGHTVGNFHHQMSLVFGKEKSVEMDFFDILFFYGIIQVCLIYGFWLKILMRLLKFDNLMYPYSAVISILIVILLTISVFAGHVLYTGMPGIFIGAILALGFARPHPEPNQKHSILKI